VRFFEDFFPGICAIFGIFKGFFFGIFLFFCINCRDCFGFLEMFLESLRQFGALHASRNFSGNFERIVWMC